MSAKGPWIRSAAFDGIWILAPAFLVSAGVLLFPGFFQGTGGSSPEVVGELPPWAWLVLVLGVDVSHVHSTWFLTYGDPAFRRARPALLVCVPLFCFVVGCTLHQLSAAFFWTGLAYLAVFHFIRQQYGFLRLYARAPEASPGSARRSAVWDAVAIYSVTGYPLLVWHAAVSEKKFHWFVDGDFISLPWLPPFLPYLARAAAFVAVAFLISEIRLAWQFPQERLRALARSLCFAGTALSWYVGIVLSRTDFPFTAANVIPHGVPYFALLTVTLKRRASRWGVLAVLGVSLAFAFVEEGLWAGWIWRETYAVRGVEFFQRFLQGFWSVEDPAVLFWLVPFLALPQATHYALDAFIWRRGGLPTVLPESSARAGKARG